MLFRIFNVMLDRVILQLLWKLHMALSTIWNFPNLFDYGLGICETPNLVLGNLTDSQNPVWGFRLHVYELLSLACLIFIKISSASLVFKIFSFKRTSVTVHAFFSPSLSI